LAAVQSGRFERWVPSAENVTQELQRLKNIAFFTYEEHMVSNHQLVVIGVLKHRRQYSGDESMRVRVEYPIDFPRSVPRVFDHDKVFVPSSAGHQHPDYGLCLHFPLRATFSTDANLLIAEVLGAALNWVIKRNIFERNGRTLWPGDTEEHGLARPSRRLALDIAEQTHNIFILLWVDWALRTSQFSKLDAPCPCISGRQLSECHGELARALQFAIYYTLQEARR
jgi:hypothetical protein